MGNRIKKLKGLRKGSLDFFLEHSKGWMTGHRQD